MGLRPHCPRLESAKADVANRLGVPSLDPPLFDFLGQVFGDWFQELASDAFALLLTGPAFFFSLGDFFQLGPGGYGVSRTHPAHDLRRRLLYERLTIENPRSFASVFRAHTGDELTDDFNSPLILKAPTKDDIFTHVHHLRRYPARQAQVLAELHDFMPRVAPLIFDHVEFYLKAHAPRMIYTVDRYDDDLRSHLQPMLLAIPPIESGTKLEERKPVAFASILNVGWAVLLTKLDDLQVRADQDPLRATRLERLHRLLLKAVELSEAKRAWESV